MKSELTKKYKEYRKIMDKIADNKPIIAEFTLYYDKEKRGIISTHFVVKNYFCQTDIEEVKMFLMKFLREHKEFEKIGASNKIELEDLR